MRAQLLALAVLALIQATEAKHHRSYAAKAEFRHSEPCPATGGTKGKCPGYVIDHLVPLCAGGLDASSNMRWQTVQDAKRKDREERRLCSKLRSPPM